MMRKASLCAALLAMSISGATADAGVVAELRSRGTHSYGEGREGPGVYGELNGAASLALSAGGSLLASGSPGGATGMAQGGLDLFLLSTAGLKATYGTYAREVASGHDMRHQSVAFTLELRPLFLPMFLYDKFTGKERLDLFLYSIGIDIGFSYERTSIGGTFGGLDERLGFHVGFGFELPLWRKADHALFLRFQVRGNFVPDTPLRTELAQLAGRSAQSIDALQVGVLLRYRFHFLETP